MPVHRVVAEVGLPADKPFGERRAAEIQHLVPRPVPVDEPRLLRPALLRLLDGAPVKRPIDFARHFLLPRYPATRTTVRHVAFPSRNAANASGSSANSIAWVYWVRWRGRRSEASRRHTSSRSGIGHCTES